MNEDHGDACPNAGGHRMELESIIGPAPAQHMRVEHVCDAHRRVCVVIWYTFCAGMASGAFVFGVVDVIVRRLW
jgi:hypothetical protein